MARPKKGGSGPRGGSRRPENPGDGPVFEENVVKVNRCAKVMKGGRRFSFSALVVVGNRDGQVGFGFGKARAVPGAVEKGVKDARKRMIKVPREGTTVPHIVTARYEASTVRLIPAAPGTGIVAGAPVRAVLELAGVKDVLTKNFGSTNPLNVVKATFAGLQGLRSANKVAELRGVTLS
jgi:small subunit ribosomal protein S5